MKIFLITLIGSIVTSTILIPSSGAQELPRALGVTFGEPYLDVFQAYKDQDYETSSIILDLEVLSPLKESSENPAGEKDIFFTATYDHPLVELPGATKTTYKVFNGRLMACEVLFSTCSEKVVFDPDCRKKYDELASVLEEKYGPSREPRKILDQIRSGFPKAFRTDSLEIVLTIKSSVSLEYTYLPLNRIKEEHERQKDLEGL